jgi:hypothetical protein
MVVAEDLPDDSSHERRHCCGMTAKRVNDYEQEQERK